MLSTDSLRTLDPRYRRLRHTAFVVVLVILAAGSAITPLIAIIPIMGAGALFIAYGEATAAEVGSFLILAVRPSLDIFSERRFGLGPFVSSPSVVLGLVILTLAVLIALRRGSRGERLWPDSAVWKTHLCLLIAYGIAIASGARLYGSTGIAQGIREAMRVLSVLAGFLIVWWWATISGVKYRRGWVFLALGAVVPIVLSLWQLRSGEGFSDILGVHRIQGTFSHPNAFAQYLVPFILVLIAAFPSRGPLERIISGCLAVGLTALLMLSYARTAILALVLGLITVPLLQARRLNIAATIRTLGAATALALAVWFFAADVIRERFSALSFGRDAIVAAQLGESENSLGWRLINWGVLISMGSQHALTGHGAGMTTVLNPLTNSDNGVPFNAHDDFVRFFFEAGLVGLLFFGLYTVLLCRWSIRLSRELPLQYAPPALGVASAVLALTLLTGGTTELSLQTADLYQIYGMLALLAALPRRESESSTG